MTIEIVVRTQQWEELDISEISQFTFLNGRGIYRHASDSDGIKRYLIAMEERYPSEAVFIAYLDGDMHAWATLSRDGPIAELGRWQPILKDSDYQNQIVDAILTKIIEYAGSNEVSRLEMVFNEIGAANEKDYALYKKWCVGNSIPLLDYIAYMTRNLTDGEIEPRPIPDELEIVPIAEMDKNDLYECYYQSFLTGNDTEFLAIDDDQRRQKFEKMIGSRTLNNRLSCALMNEKRPIGLAVYLSREDEEHLDRFCLRQEYRGKGIAKAFLLSTMAKAKSEGIEALTLGVDITNDSAFKLYNSLGFEVISRIVTHSKKIGEV
jgi:ribosomal protein S18 acetylase RimI-like enzyme